MAQNFGRRALLVGAATSALGLAPSKILASSGATPVGICADISKADKSEIDSVMRAVRHGNLKFVRWDIQWQSVELAKDQFTIPPNWDYIADAVSSAGAENIGILCYGNRLYDGGDKPVSEEAQAAFARFSGAIAQHFKGRIKRYEVWNEWDAKTGSASYQPIKAYIQLLKKCYPVLKSIDATNQILAGNFSEYTLSRYPGSFFDKNYLKDFLNSDAGHYMDGFSLHPYVRGLSKDETGRSIDSFFTNLKQAIRSTPIFRDMPIFITEIGWQTRGGSAAIVDEHTQAYFLQEAVRLARKHAFDGFCIFKVRDGNNDGYGIYKQDWRPKVAGGFAWN